ncbi:hypothetical protein Tco_0920685 [Tanacetum coccineum]
MIKHEDIDENGDEDKVADTLFDDEEVVKSFVEEKDSDNKKENSEDPFNIYSILNRRHNIKNAFKNQFVFGGEPQRHEPRAPFTIGINFGKRGNPPLRDLT